MDYLKSQESDTTPEQEKFREEHEEPLPPLDDRQVKESNTNPHHDSDDFSSDVSSVFSESRHTEGPRSIRRSSTSLSRTQSKTLQRAQTAASTVLSTIRSRAPRGQFTHPLTHEKTSPDNIVDFDGPDDPYRPMNWSFKKKCICTGLYGFTAMFATFGSSVYSPAVNEIAQEFNVGSEVSILGISLLLVGFGIGPLVWAPLSEVYGRKLAVLTPFFIASMFTFGAGAAENLETLLVTRFFQGFFGSAPVTNTGGVLGDIWTADVRGVALIGYAMAVVGGPTLGPIIGGAIVVTGTSWRWTQYVTGIGMMFMVVLDVIVLDESYAPVLLVKKARTLRYESGNWALHAPHEEWNVTLSELGHKYLVRPFQLLATPICFLMAL